MTPLAQKFQGVGGVLIGRTIHAGGGGGGVRYGYFLESHNLHLQGH